MADSLNSVIQNSRACRASDVHIVCGLPIKIRVDGNLVDYDDFCLNSLECEAYAKELVGSEYSKIEAIGELDIAKTFYGNIRCRINVFRQSGSFSVAIRILADKIPDLNSLGLPPAVQTFPIREGKTPQIASAISTSAADGSITMDNSLIQLCRQWVISAETARRSARDIDYVKRNTVIWGDGI